MEINNIFHLLLFLFFVSSLSPASTTFSPTDNYLLDCGSSQSSVIDNRNFFPDSPSNLLPSPTTISLKDETASPNSPSLYHTARIFTKTSNYVFDIKQKGTHLVRLHFFPFNSSQFNLLNAHFHVSVNGYLLLNDFNAKSPILKEYMIWVENGKLEIVFTPLKETSFAFVNAIEVFSAPHDLIADKAKFIDSEGNRTIGGITNQGLETVYRLNVGGPKVTPFNDTLWRTWIPDHEFLKSSSGESKEVHFGGRIKYQDGGLSREVAPDNVFSSARIIGSISKGENLNVTWILPVNVGYRYLVRLHFCDIASMALYELYFNVYINGNTVYEDFDLSKIMSMLASPYYADFVVDADKLGFISVSMSPSSINSSSRVNAILNGLEVMKMNNSMGSLDGDVSVVSLLRTHSSGSSGGALVPSVAICSLLIVAFAFMYKKRSMAQDFVGWSPLPVDPSEGNPKYDNQPSCLLPCLSCGFRRILKFPPTNVGTSVVSWEVLHVVPTFYLGEYQRKQKIGRMVARMQSPTYVRTTPSELCLSLVWHLQLQYRSYPRVPSKKKAWIILVRSCVRPTNDKLTRGVKKFRNLFVIIFVLFSLLFATYLKD